MDRRGPWHVVAGAGGVPVVMNEDGAVICECRDRDDADLLRAAPEMRWALRCIGLDQGVTMLEEETQKQIAWALDRLVNREDKTWCANVRPVNGEAERARTVELLRNLALAVHRSTDADEASRMLLLRAAEIESGSIAGITKNVKTESVVQMSLNLK